MVREPFNSLNWFSSLSIRLKPEAQVDGDDRFFNPDLYLQSTDELNKTQVFPLPRQPGNSLEGYILSAGTCIMLRPRLSATESMFHRHHRSTNLHPFWVHSSITPHHHAINSGYVQAISVMTCSSKLLTIRRASAQGWKLTTTHLILIS